MGEKELVKRCQKGDKKAFEELVERFYPYVSGFLLKTTRNSILAEDLTQETFLKMIHNIEKYRPEGASFGTWLISIAKNCYTDHLRKDGIKLEELSEAELFDGLEDPAGQAVEKMTYEEVQKLLLRLSPEQGLAIRLKYEEGLTLEEIARKFGVPPKTVKSRIHEGTEKLRRLLKDKERMGVL